jgi:outer membrane biosynthesis protein TonB
MDRTQKKCVLASFGVHALLCLLLLVGPAFLRSKEVPDNSPILDFVAYKTVDDLASGGGRPDAKTTGAELPKPLPTPPKVEPKPEPKPEVVTKPEPKPEVKKVEPEFPKEPAVKQLVNPDALEPIEKKSKVRDVSTTLVTRKDNQEEKKKQAEQAAKAEAKKQAAARKQMADKISQVADNLSSGLSSGTTIELKGPGGGGVPYANFFQAVKSVYARAWVLPDGVTDDQATTTATVLIARDGTVVNARITNFSRNSEVDRSVQATLERVKWAAPLPDSEVKNQREVTINFNVKAKKASG